MTPARREARRRSVARFRGLAVAVGVGLTASMLAGCSGQQAVTFAGSDKTPDNPLSWDTKSIYEGPGAAVGYSQSEACKAMGIDPAIIKLLQAPYLVAPTHQAPGVVCDYSDNVPGQRPAKQTTSATLDVTMDRAAPEAAKYVYDMFALGAPQATTAPAGYTTSSLHLGSDSAIVTNGYNMWTLVKANGYQYGIEFHGDGSQGRAYYTAALTATLKQLIQNVKHPLDTAGGQ